jgi:D-glycerate 3-kinase
MKSFRTSKYRTLQQFAHLYGSTDDIKIARKFRKDFSSWLAAMQLPDLLINDLQDVYIPFINLLRKEKYLEPGRIPVIGISGSQGSGKSTFTSLLTKVLESAYGYKVASLSMDDFYHSRAEREALSCTVHPLLITRGVPGTHDLKTGFRILDELLNSDWQSMTAIPVFDKSVDDRLPPQQWRIFKGRPDIILFEGWCVGANPETEEQLSVPVNDFENKYDHDKNFRRFVNDQLKSNYKSWFSKINFLVMLKVPSFDQVFEWRLLQEQKLIEKVRIISSQGKPLKIMSENELRFFISHFERITMNMLNEMPLRANLIMEVGKNHRIGKIRIN